MDAQAEADRRIQSVTVQRSDHKIDKKVMLELQAMMHEHNPYVASFKALMDIPDEEVLFCEKTSCPSMSTKVVIICQPPAMKLR